MEGPEAKQSTPGLRCAYCHAEIGPEAQECPNCGTLLHQDCRELAASCPTLGCDEVVPAGANTTTVRRFWLGLAALIVLFAALPRVLKQEPAGFAAADPSVRVLASASQLARGLGSDMKLGLPSATWVPIFFESVNAVTEAVGQRSLRSTDLPEGQQELRIWVGFGISAPMEYLRLRATQDKVRGELYLWWSTQYSAGRDFALEEFVTKRFACQKLQRGRMATACRARFSETPDWGQVLDLLERNRVWSLPDPSTLKGEVDMMDGTGVLVEVRDGPRYRAYLYSNPSRQPWPEAKNAEAILGVVAGLSYLSRIK